MFKNLSDKVKNFVSDPQTIHAAKEIGSYILIAGVAIGLQIAVKAIYESVTGSTSVEVPTAE